MTDKLKIVIEIPNTGLEEDILRKGEWEDDSLFGRSLRNALMQFTEGHEWIVDALDKIRVKIEGYKSTIDNAISEDALKIEGMKEAYADCLNAIDEYKAEIEPQERSDKE